MCTILHSTVREPLRIPNMAELHIVHINIRGLRANAVELQCYVEQTRPDIVLLNETKLVGKPAPRIAGYKVAAVRDRSLNGIAGGGVAIYVSRSFFCTDISPDEDDMVAIEVRTSCLCMAIVSYYRPPGPVDLSEATLETYFSKYDRCILAGDLNAKHQFYGCKATNAAGEQLFDIVERNDLVVVNQSGEVTRHDVHSGSSELLDLFVVTRKLAGKVLDCYVGDDVGSDHFPVHLKLQLRGCIQKVPERLVRPLSKCNWKSFSDVIVDNMSIMHLEELISRSAIDQRCEEIQNCIMQAIDIACPKVTVKMNAFRVSRATLALIRQKRKLRRKCQKSDDATLKTVYNNLSRQVKAAILAEKSKSWQEATAGLDNLRGADLWRKFKLLTGAGASERRIARISKADGSLTADQIETADVFAKHLASVHVTHDGPDFCQAFRDDVEASVKRDAVKYTARFSLEPDVGDDSPLVQPVTAGEISAALRKCKTRSAPGEDEISYSMLKRLPELMLLILSQLYTVCLLVGYFPPVWKSAIGVMLPKPGKDNKLASSYRPISLLSTLGKLFERVIATRMQSHFDDTGFFNEWQRAYLKNKEATEHVYRLGEFVKLAKQRSWCATAVSLDVEKAFDSVWYDGLRRKLSDLGLPHKLIRLLSSFLSDRTIRVRVGQTLSQSVRLLAGTPQGSVLSPLLYIVYVNDLPVDPRNKCETGQFADDVSMWTIAKSKKQTFMRLQRALNDLEAWCSTWRIKLNVTKTQLVSFKRSRWKGVLRLSGAPLTEQKEMKLLGVTFGMGGSLRSHCQEKAGAAAKRLNLMRALSGQSWGASSRTLLTLYKQYIRPVLETGSVCTAEACPSMVVLLQRIQNSAMRTALRAGRRTRISRLHSLSKLEPMSVRLKRLRAGAVARFGQSVLIERLELQKLLLHQRATTSEAVEPDFEGVTGPVASNDQM